MNSSSKFDILAEVKHYLATATREEVAADIRAAQFDELVGAGERISPETGLPEDMVVSSGAKTFSAQLTMTTVLQQNSPVFSKLFRVQATALATDSLSAGNYEEMPMAA